MRDNVAMIDGMAAKHGENTALSNPPRRFDLVIRDSKDGTVEGTHVSEPLKRAISRKGGKIYELI